MPLAQPQKQRIPIPLSEKMKQCIQLTPAQYGELFLDGYDFAELVTAHDSSMEPGGDRSTDGRP
jgi:hypothetical protein